MCFLPALSSSTHWVQAKMRGWQGPKRERKYIDAPESPCKGEPLTDQWYICTFYYVCAVTWLWGSFS